ncbi:ATP phosphoribosyltransferase regulatory subunit [hydrothermal vent metagenome]|uniref:ATP phosphoribosyltransferase regulatory subunit n=1 Tax=hydrothermal vent metagenome TaxID=652676 RepID=A0A1W1BN05_9ZZZZ
MPKTWLSPEGIGELVGEQAYRFESIRRTLLDYYMSKDCHLVFPAMAENVDSLLLNQSKSLDVKTFKVIDQNTGNMLGIRSDITTQIARIDSYYTKDKKQAKFCYINSILQTQNDDFYSGRSPIQAGVELYGNATVEGDIELIYMMIESMKLLNINDITLNLSNIAIFNYFIDNNNLSLSNINKLKEIFSQKSAQQLDLFFDNIDCLFKEELKLLLDLNGNVEVLKIAKEKFLKFKPLVQILDQLILISDEFKTKVSLHFDLAEVKHYEYHTGLLFSIFHHNYPKAIAQGGRYDNLAENFGNSRPASGFSFDLKYLIQQQ